MFYLPDQLWNSPPWSCPSSVLWTWQMLAYTATGRTSAGRAVVRSTFPWHCWLFPQALNAHSGSLASCVSGHQVKIQAGSTQHTKKVFDRSTRHSKQSWREKKPHNSNQVLPCWGPLWRHFVQFETWLVLDKLCWWICLDIHLVQIGGIWRNPNENKYIIEHFLIWRKFKIPNRTTICFYL